MKALIKPQGQIGLKLIHDAPMPSVGPQDVLIQVLAASICGSDLHIYDNDPVFRERISDGQIVGHEFCGVVKEVGLQVTTIAVGDIVSAESHVVCGTCKLCLTNNSHNCLEISSIGFDRAGGFAEYVAIPAQNAIRKPEKLPVEVATLLEPFGNALDTALCVNLVGKTVLVTGCGPQGLMAIAVAKASGARRVIATEIHADRRELASEIIAAHAEQRRLAEDLVLDPSDPHTIDSIFDATDGLGVDVVLEMSGHPTAIIDGFTVLKNCGDFVALGLPSQPLEFDWARFVVLKGATIRGVYGRHLFDTWYKAHDLLESRAVQLEKIITHRLPIEQFEKAFQLLKQGKAAKIILYPNMEDL